MGFIYKRRYIFDQKKLKKKRQFKKIPWLWNDTDLPEGPNANTPHHDKCVTYCSLGDIYSSENVWGKKQIILY